MASNFNILFKRKNGDLHIDLKGDFDGSSAKILYNALKRNCDEDSNKNGRYMQRIYCVFKLCLHIKIEEKTYE